MEPHIPHGMHDILAVIPARGGSKGILRKNITLLGSKPLIAYSIEVALKSRLITRIVVSTEDEEIAEVARAYGAEVPFLRPAELAQDHSDLGDSLKYTKERLAESGYMPQGVVHLSPTSPFRNPRLVDFMIGKLFEGYQHIITARAIPAAQRGYRVLDAETGLTHAVATQQLPCSRTCRPYGVLTGDRLTPAYRGTYVHYLDDPVMLIDIDTHEDLRLAQKIVGCGLFDFGAA